MNFRSLLPVSLISAAPLASAALLPAEVGVTTDLTFVSEYVFRGIEFADRSFQPSVEVDAGDFYAGLWANLPIENRDTGDTELNYFAGYNFVLPQVPLQFDAGLVVYHFPDTGSRRTHEVFLGASMADLWLPGLVASTYYFFDMDLYTHVVEGSLGYEWDLEAFNIPGTTLGARIFGGLQGQSEAKAESYNYYGASLEVAYALTQGASLGAGVHYATAEKYSFDAAAGERGKNLFWTLSLTSSF